MSSALRDALRDLGPAMPRTFSGKATFSATVMCGNRA